MMTQKHLNPMLERCFQEIMAFDFEPHYCKGRDLVLPDRLSRLYPSYAKLPTEEPLILANMVNTKAHATMYSKSSTWKLAHKLFSRAREDPKFGPFTVDMFANHENKQLKRFCSNLIYTADQLEDDEEYLGNAFNLD